jgi:hypothetical protein
MYKGIKMFRYGSIVLYWAAKRSSLCPDPWGEHNVFEKRTATPTYVQYFFPYEAILLAIFLAAGICSSTNKQGFIEKALTRKASRTPNPIPQSNHLIQHYLDRFR